jgi:hypothetical protein
LRFISVLLERDVFVFASDAESKGDKSWLPEIELEKRRRLGKVIEQGIQRSVRIDYGLLTGRQRF